MGEIVHVKGEGGAVWRMDLALMPKPTRQRLEKGYLKVVNPDGSTLAPAAAVEPDRSGSDLTDGKPAKPSERASKSDWVIYAVNALDMNPDDAEAATKQDLIDLAGE